MAKKGVLLLNIGSPESYQVQDVKTYLLNFLMDRDVIDLPWIVRYPLVNWIIVPKRAPFSAANYKKVWMEGEGSPLTVFSDRFAKKLQTALGSEYSVKVGMRYAEPTIDRALAEFSSEGLKDLLIVPMFPQYAEATTGSSVKYTLNQIQKRGGHLNTQVLPAFFDEECFINPSADLARQTVSGKEVDHFLFSFHGLPESHVKKIEGCLITPDCCLQKNACAKNCYRAQCFASAQAIANRLGLQKNQWSVSFQSRLGRAEWLKPSTEHSIQELAKRGLKSIAVICPSFVADCIETLEEIGIGGEEVFHEHGGKEFNLVPCVNENDAWVSGFAELIKN
ncbi:ferrochelatase [Bdellovibrio bacteriovorus]|uniref:Ferrochelatase n=1 Tax=Bdellovibrio bacteriovorus TaxID=959 RepID=A0A150WPM7_BDEBC|nr:ferrochelatase [Bdellovibrio bacteriovorus]KYG66257.1 ferrochelatase [Bdellovibrio bacteriovorus]